jgi:hypothetical protein
VLAELGDDAGRVLLGADEVQHAEQQHRNGPTEVEAPGQRFVPEHGVRVAYVRPDGDHAVPRREQRVIMGDHDRIVVHVHDLRVRGDLAGDLVHAGRGGQAAAQVEKLRYALPGEEAHRPAEEAAVRQGEPPRVEP